MSLRQTAPRAVPCALPPGVFDQSRCAVRRHARMTIEAAESHLAELVEVLRVSIETQSNRNCVIVIPPTPRYEDDFLSVVFRSVHTQGPVSTPLITCFHISQNLYGCDKIARKEGRLPAWFLIS